VRYVDVGRVPADFDGDGWSDVLVGAEGSDAGATDAGRAYVFRGGPWRDASPDVVLGRATAGARFGFAVAGAGDLNADGFGDLVVGAHLADPWDREDGGRACLVTGPLDPGLMEELDLSGEAARDHFGVSVARGRGTDPPASSPSMIVRQLRHRVGRVACRDGARRDDAGPPTAAPIPFLRGRR
jgi:hypothetical protein